MLEMARSARKKKKRKAKKKLDGGFSDPRSGRSSFEPSTAPGMVGRLGEPAARPPATRDLGTLENAFNKSRHREGLRPPAPATPGPAGAASNRRARFGRARKSSSRPRPHEGMVGRLGEPAARPIAAAKPWSCKSRKLVKVQASSSASSWLSTPARAPRRPVVSSRCRRPTSVILPAGTVWFELGRGSDAPPRSGRLLRVKVRSAQREGLRPPAPATPGPAGAASNRRARLGREQPTSTARRHGRPPWRACSPADCRCQALVVQESKTCQSPGIELGEQLAFDAGPSASPPGRLEPLPPTHLGDTARRYSLVRTRSRLGRTTEVGSTAQS